MCKHKMRSYVQPTDDVSLEVLFGATLASLIPNVTFLKETEPTFQGEFRYGKLQGANDRLLFLCGSRQREIESFLPAA